MKHKTLFRLLLKFLGVWVGSNGIIGIVNTTVNWIGNAYLRPAGMTYSYPYWLSFAGGVTGLALGLYLFFGGKWIVDLAIPSNRPYCHECGYDLTGAAGNICNECGTPFRPPAQTDEVTASHE